MSILGFDGKLYYNDADLTTTAPNFVEILNCRDVTTTASSDASDSSDRGSFYKNFIQGMIDLETTTTLTYRNADTTVEYFQNLFETRGTTILRVLDGDNATTGTQGYEFGCFVASLDFEQTLNDSMTFNITFKPTYVELMGGSPVNATWITIS